MFQVQIFTSVVTTPRRTGWALAQLPLPYTTGFVVSFLLLLYKTTPNFGGEFWGLKGRLILQNLRYMPFLFILLLFSQLLSQLSLSTVLLFFTIIIETGVPYGNLSLIRTKGVIYSQPSIHLLSPPLF